MKTNFLVIMAILVIAFGSCESDEFIEKKRTSINLVAPNGQKIATTIEELTTLVAETVEKKYGENKDVEIDKVVYHDAEIGFIAEIKYVTYDGHSSNLIMSNAALGSSIKMKRLKTRGEGGGVDKVVVYYCENGDSKKCPDCEIAKTSNGISCFCSKGDRSVCDLKEKEL